MDHAERIERLRKLQAEGADIRRAFSLVRWTREEGLQHLEEFLEDIAKPRVEMKRGLRSTERRA